MTSVNQHSRPCKMALQQKKNRPSRLPVQVVRMRMLLNSWMCPSLTSVTWQIQMDSSAEPQGPLACLSGRRQASTGSNTSPEARVSLPLCSQLTPTPLGQRHHARHQCQPRSQPSRTFFYSPARFCNLSTSASTHRIEWHAHSPLLTAANPRPDPPQDQDPCLDPRAPPPPQAQS